MTGDSADISGRLRRYLPKWFGSALSTPVLDALLGGIADIFAGVYDLIVFARRQTRIATSTGGWLDITAFSFLGDILPRFQRETEDSYRDRLRREIFRDRNTRKAGIDILTELTGTVPFAYEAWYGPVCGGLGSPSFALGRVGRIASRHAPAQVIFHLPLPQNYGIPSRGGLGNTVGGLGHGNFSLVDESEITGSGPSRLEILQRLDSVRTDGVEYLVFFSSPPT